MLNKYKNNSQKSRVSGALELITNESDQFFVGDEMLVLNKSMHFMDDEDFVNYLNKLRGHLIIKAWHGGFIT